ncbi:MAG: HupE/UreJ family protein [Proteobacteria bacterium]|nr:HupE/UreJ family protein [Pseudomonadota bacterium]
MSRLVLRNSLVVVALLLSAMFGSQVMAHNRSQSYSSWQLTDTGVEVLFTVKAREVTRLPPLEGNLLSLDALLLAHLQQTLSVTTGQGDCLASGTPVALSAAPGYVRAKWSFDCDLSDGAVLGIDSFFSMAPGHVHYARVAYGEELPEELLFTESSREHAISLKGGPHASFYRAFTQYLLLGVEHILDGADHIAFLIALLLLVRRLRELVWIVSGFTVGHSVTLTLAALGLAVPEIPVVEAVIGFTIAVVAIENVGAVSGTNRQLGYLLSGLLVLLGLVSSFLGRGLPLLTLCGLLVFSLAYLPLSTDERFAIRMRPLLTLVFGLIHGFGFAGVLTEIGLPQERLVAALTGFNIGVEIGQLIIVTGIWLLVRGIYHSGVIHNRRPWLDATSAALCSVGFYWFISRGFAPVY